MDETQKAIHLMATIGRDSEGLRALQNHLLREVTLDFIGCDVSNIDKLRACKIKVDYIKELITLFSNTADA